MKKKIQVLMLAILLVVVSFNFHMTEVYADNEEQTSNVANTEDKVGYITPQITVEKVAENDVNQVKQQEEDNSTYTFEYYKTSDNYWASMSTTYFYDGMTDDEKTLYDNLYNAALSLLTGTSSSTYIQGSYSGLSQSEAINIAVIFEETCPQFYFLLPKYSISYSTSTSGYMRLYVDSSYQDGTLRQTATNEIKTYVDELLSTVSEESTDVAKEQLIYETLAAHIEYDYDALSSDDLLMKEQSASSAILDGKTVCAGYSASFEMICNSAGIETISVTSSTHEWNEIQLDGKWYNVDLTWGDEGDTASTSYLNISDTSLCSGNTSHSVESYWTDHFRPICDNGTYVANSSSGTIDVTGVGLNDVSLTLDLNDTYTLYAAVMPSDATDQDVSWTSSNTAVATVSDGIVTAVGSGTATISVITAEDSYVKSCEVTVNSGYTNVIPDGVYKISSALNNKVLDVSGGSSSNGGNIQMYSDNDTAAQKFEVLYNAEGYYTITNINSQKVLEVAGGSTSNGGNIQQYTANGTDAQKWYIVESSTSGYYILVNVNSGLVIDIAGGNTSNGANVQQYNQNNSSAQKYAFTYVSGGSSEQVVDDGTYVIGSSLDTTKVLDIPSASTLNGANIQLYQANGTAAQEYSVSYNQCGYYTITNVNSNKVLEVSGGDVSNGGNIQQYESNGTYAQKWFLQQTSDGYYYFINVKSGKAMDVTGANLSNGTNIQQYTLNGSGAQKFSLL